MTCECTLFLDAGSLLFVAFTMLSLVSMPTTMSGVAGTTM
jgi:hypothetical protein